MTYSHTDTVPTWIAREDAGGPRRPACALGAGAECQGGRLYFVNSQLLDIDQEIILETFYQIF